jgi:hypothetical protein
MATEFVEQIGTFAKRGDERQPRNAAPAASPETGFVEADNDCRSMIIPRDSRSDDSENACVPAACTEHDRRSFGEILLRNPHFRGVDYFTLHILTFAVLLVQVAGQRARFDGIRRQEKSQGLFRGREATGCVQTGSQPETDMFRRDRWPDGRDVH